MDINQILGVIGFFSFGYLLPELLILHSGTGKVKSHRVLNVISGISTAFICVSIIG